jgi:hypothetical protein
MRRKYTKPVVIDFGSETDISHGACAVGPTNICASGSGPGGGNYNGQCIGGNIASSCTTGDHTRPGPCLAGKHTNG